MSPTTASAQSALSSYNAPSAQDVLSQANNQYGVGADQTRVSDLRGAVANLNSSLEAVDPSVTGRTSGTFTTEAQRSALVNKEQAPIQQNLSDRGTDLSNASSDLNQATGNAGTLAGAIMSQNQQQYQKLLDQYNAATAQDTQAEQTREFNASLAEKTAADKASAAAANINPASYLGTQTPSTPDKYASVDKQGAANAITGLLKTNNTTTIANTLKAINASAKNGNLYDQYKQELLQQYQQSSPYATLLQNATNLMNHP